MTRRASATLRRTLVAALATATAFAVGAPSEALAARSCADVVNPYEGTRYDGINLSRIRADRVGCRKARRVARGAHRKALKIAPNPNGVRHFRWRGWRVKGNLRPNRDRYVAKRGGKRVRWRF